MAKRPSEPASGGRPFVHRFRTEHNYYAYDVNLNTVLRLEPIEYSVLDDFGRLTLIEILQKYKDSYTLKQLKDAYRRIEQIRRFHGFFSENRPQHIVYPLDEVSLRRLHEASLTTLLLSVTEQCNLRCDYCAFSGTYSNNRKHTSKRMEWDIAKRAIDFLRAHSKMSEHVHLGFYGGEPLLRASFVERCMDYASSIFGRKPLTFGITTNGTRLRESIFRMLVANNVDLLVSVDGPQAVHDRYRRYIHGGPTFEPIIQNLSKLQNAFPDYYLNKVSFNMVFAPPYDYDAIREFVRSYPLINQNKFELSFVSTHNSSFFDRFSPSDLSMIEFENGATQYFEALESQSMRGANLDPDRLPWRLFLKGLEALCTRLTPTPPLPSSFHPGGICIPGERKLFVSADGRFFPCERVNSSNDLYSLGSVYSGLDTTKALSLISNYTKVHDECRDCYALRHCGVCFVDTAVTGAFSKSEKMARCESARELFDKRMTTIMRLLEKDIPLRDFAKNLTIL